MTGAVTGADRLVLGTVQLGIPYGRKRGLPPPSKAASRAVLDRAFELGIRAFDTAQLYGPAAEWLAEWLIGEGRAAESSVVTKVNIDPVDTLEKRATRAVSPFSECSAVLLLSHGFADDGWERFTEAADKIGARAGMSLYAPAEVLMAVRAQGVHRIQVPGNVFDRRGLDVRDAAGDVPCDVRSVFLQGVLLDDPETAELRVRGGGALSAAVHAAAPSGRAPALLVAAVLQRLRATDRVVIGADAPGELSFVEELTEVKGGEAETFVAAATSRAGTVSDRILDPRLW